MKVLRGFAIFFLLLGALYLVGPRVETPELNESPVSVPSDLMSLERWITEKENALGNVRSGNASQIIFNDSVPKKTKFSVLYLHGFTASGREGEPVHRDIAKALGANLYIPRLYGHGLEETEPMLGFNNEDFWESGKEALAVAKQLGEKVIVLGTSHGGALSLSLATDPDIAALCLFGPNIAVYDPKAKLLSKPWGLQIARLVKGGNYHYMVTSNEEKKNYWTTKARLESLIHMQKFLDVKMRKATFKKVQAPVFLGYYYKNDSLQDQVVSVPAMLEMYDQLGTPQHLKQKKAFPEAGDHVLTSYLSTENYEAVTREVLQFLSDKLNI
ncbi:alpha/beta fold hydrolase [Flavobacteriaceae bacterium]|jgi:esterase/lipase|nr:alpha/beta fold hydrolase [Flavobacteriaceae bacterium]MDC0916687.1 alpha/beta fold hydrolase [Flavobacteriaceae bacterium]MDC3329935.1 alpha/beta fold hydrolase [Flavobacteriaceae bacterium]